MIYVALCGCKQLGNTNVKPDVGKTKTRQRLYWGRNVR